MGKKLFLTQSDLRVDNLKQFIKDHYQNSNRSFYKEFRKNLKYRMQYTEIQIDTKQKMLQQAMGKYKNKTFSKSLQRLVECAFELPKEILSRIRPERSPAYIFLSCSGKSANILFEELKNNPIIDEVSVLFGDVDVYIKVYGTSEEVQELITIDLYNIDGLVINNTRTYFTLNKRSWVRYSASSHPDYEPPANRWSTF